MLQIRMLLVKASGSSVFFLPLLWWHATQRRCENDIGYFGLSQSQPPRNSALLLQILVRKCELSLGVYLIRPSRLAKKRLIMLLIMLTSVVISTVADDWDIQSHACVTHGYGKMDYSSAASCRILSHWLSLICSRPKKRQGLVGTTAIACLVGLVSVTAQRPRSHFSSGCVLLPRLRDQAVPAAAVHSCTTQEQDYGEQHPGRQYALRRAVCKGAMRVWVVYMWSLCHRVRISKCQFQNAQPLNRQLIWRIQKRFASCPGILRDDVNAMHIDQPHSHMNFVWNHIKNIPSSLLFIWHHRMQDL